MKSLLTNHHLQGYRLLYYILQTYHPLYNEDASDHIIERPQQQFYDNSVQCMVKLPMQEYYDAYACYLMLKTYVNDSSKTLVDLAELRIFFHRCIRGKNLLQATRFDRKKNNECMSRFFLTILSNLSYWSTVGCLPNDVPLTGFLTILLTDVLMVVPEAHANPTLHVIPPTVDKVDT